MKKIRLNCTATLDETFADFLLSRRAKGLAEKTLESYSSQWKAVARHLDTGTDIAALQKADLDAMIVSMRDAGLSPNSINSYTRVLKSFFSWCNEQGLTRLNNPPVQGRRNRKGNLFGRGADCTFEKARHSQDYLCGISGLGDYQFPFELREPRRDGRGDTNSGRGFGRRHRHTKNRKAQVIPLCSPMIAILREYGRYRGGEPILHGDGYTTDGERLAAIYRKIQHAARSAKNFYSPVPPHIRTEISD